MSTVEIKRTSTEEQHVTLTRDQWQAILVNGIGLDIRNLTEVEYASDDSITLTFSKTTEQVQNLEILDDEYSK